MKSTVGGLQKLLYEQQLCQDQWSGVYGAQITPEVKHVFEHIVDGLFHSFGNQLMFSACCLAVTGARGCKACDYGRELLPEKAVVQHPVDGKFTRGLYAPTTFFYAVYDS